MPGMSTYVFVVISPAMSASPVVTSVSHATRPIGSSFRIASRMASEIWSAILSGWPSVTDSDVKRLRYLPMFLCSKAAVRRSAEFSRALRASRGGNPGAENEEAGSAVAAAVGGLQAVRREDAIVSAFVEQPAPGSHDGQKELKVGFGG